MLLLENDQHRETNDLFNLRVGNFITTFNLAGAIIIIQLDKKEQAKIPYFNGDVYGKAQKSLLHTGILIVIFGVSVGLIVGSIICYLQQHFGFFKATAALPLPVKNRVAELPIVAATALYSE